MSEFVDTSDELLGSAVTLSSNFIRPLSRWWLIATLQICEALVVAASSYSWLTDITFARTQKIGLIELLTCGLTVSLAVHFVLRALGAYDFIGILNTLRSCATAAFAWALATAGLLFWAIELGTGELDWQVSWFDWLVGGLLIVVVRLLIAQTGSALLRLGWICHDVVIIGNGAEAQLCAQLLRNDRAKARLIGFVFLDMAKAAGSAIAGWQRLGGELRHVMERYRVRDVIVATSGQDRPWLPELVQSLHGLPVRVLLWPPSCGADTEWFARSDDKIGGVPLLLVSAPPLDGWRWALKDSRDRFLAALILAFISPLLVCISIAIRLSSRGPILFRQEREGYNGQSFTIFKFRTMRVSNPPVDELTLTARGDPRVFPLGALLRRTSLDELPQLLNVVRGDMWLVGPRPHSPLATAAGQRYANAVQEYMSRFRVKPGITGWAQVNGFRGPTYTLHHIQQRVAYDLYYIEHLSVWFDLQILLHTAIKGFVHKNAF
jgi:Undecaprenyl-phosphate glucose phosphotransferase